VVVVSVRREVVWDESMTWWRLAERYLGDGALWPAVWRANAHVCPVDVLVGAVLVIPSPAPAEGL